MMKLTVYCLLFPSVALSSRAFLPHRQVKTTRSKLQNLNEQDDEIFVRRIDVALDANLLPPPINIRKESILFGDNPATMDNNNALRLWKSLKGTLPFVFTGARRPDTGDENPIGAIFNILFVRLPVILAGLAYGKNSMEGHPLVMDFGNGPHAMNLLLVLAVIFFILQ